MAEHPVPASRVEGSEPDTAMTLLVVLVGAVVLAVVVVFIQGLYERAAESQFETKVVAEAPAELRQLRIAQLDRLHRVGWADKSRGLVTLPIERAMALLLEEPNPAAPVVPPAAPEAAR